MAKQKIIKKHDKEVFVYLPKEIDPEENLYSKLHHKFSDQFSIAELEDLKQGHSHYHHKYRVKFEYLGITP
jgi:hypothetical protein